MQHDAHRKNAAPVQERSSSRSTSSLRPAARCCSQLGKVKPSSASWNSEPKSRKLSLRHSAVPAYAHRVRRHGNVMGLTADKSAGALSRKHISAGVSGMKKFQGGFFLAVVVVCASSNSVLSADGVTALQTNKETFVAQSRNLACERDCQVNAQRCDQHCKVNNSLSSRFGGPTKCWSDYCLPNYSSCKAGCR